ncbi:MAG: hypothetical protein KGO50_18800, partial [Myxococcales bacterium]|nr:hypothetical protein [Myxococcales bacterium]
ISRVLLRHGFGDLLSREAFSGGDENSVFELPRDSVRRFRAMLKDRADVARRFRGVLEELGPTFVKVGQILSTRSDLLPPEFIAELSQLQDNVPALPFDVIREVIEFELGKPLSEAFREFTAEPLASASIAQTHRAVLPGRTEVVIKVQRPGIAATIRADLDLMYAIARLLEASFTEMEFYSPVAVVRALDEALTREIDFQFEADNLEEFGELFANDPGIIVPGVFRTHSTRAVLTMDLVQGLRIIDVERDSAEAHEAALLLVDSFYRQIFIHGRFHGDPHPGNLFVVRKPSGLKLAFIDFGLCGSLSSLQRDQLVTLVVSVLSGDIDGTARVLIRMGKPVGNVDIHEFKLEVASIRERHFKRRLNQINMSAFLRDAFDAAQRYRIRVAAEYSVLSKAAVTVEGVVRALAPSLDLHTHIKPYSTRLLQEHYAPEKLVKGAISGTLHLANFLREVPEQLGQVLLDLESGRLTVQMQNPGLNGLSNDLNQQTTRMFMALVCAGLTVSAPIWYYVEPLRIWHDRIPVMTTLSLLSAVCLAFWGLVWHVGAVRRDRRLSLSRLLRLLRGNFY